MLGAFALFSGVMLLAGWAFLLRDWLVSTRWQGTRATVRGTVVVPARQTDPLRPWRERAGYRPVIRYAYTVGDQTYVGQRFGATQEPFFASEREAEAFTDSFPVGATVRARVNPDNPRDSLLRRDLSLADALPGYLAFGCLLVGLLLL